MSIIAPSYIAADRFNSTARNAVIPGSVVDDPVVEHEHHHVHHHIDHGSIGNSMALAAPRRESRDFSYDEVYDRERRMSGNVHVSSHVHHNHDHKDRERRYHRHHRHRSNGGRGYSRSDMDLSDSRRSSVVNVSGTTDWTIIDVPPGTRRITLDTTGHSHNHSHSHSSSREDVSITGSRYATSGVRRSRGLASELWTEITKDLVTREAIEELKYPFEETEYFYYIFEYLHQDQITELIELTADIRHERVKDLEFSRIANAGPANPPPGTHYIEDRCRVEDRLRVEEDRPEIVYTDERTTRRSRKYYY